MIKRFNPDFSLSISHELAYMRETPEGGYVAHGDYATLFSELESVKAERDALAVRNEQLTAFLIEGFNIAAQGGSWCGGDIQELGEKLGLAARETYQPVLHGYICGHEPGEDSVYVITKSTTSAAISAIGADLMAEGADACVRALVTSDDEDFADAPNICAMVARQLREAK